MSGESSRGPSGPELRIGDAEREAAVGALGEHYAAGRLTKEEYDERADRAWAARTRSALWPLFTDLPRPEPARPAPPPAGERFDGPARPPRHPGWRSSRALLPVLLVALVIAASTGKWLLPVVLVAFVLWRSSHYWGSSVDGRRGDRHHPGQRGHGRRRGGGW